MMFTKISPYATTEKCVKWGFYMWGICNVGAIILRNFGGHENVSFRWTTRQATKCGSLMVGGK